MVQKIKVHNFNIKIKPILGEICENHLVLVSVLLPAVHVSLYLLVGVNTPYNVMG